MPGKKMTYVYCVNAPINPDSFNNTSDIIVDHSTVLEPSLTFSSPDDCPSSAFAGGTGIVNWEETSNGIDVTVYSDGSLFLSKKTDHPPAAGSPGELCAKIGLMAHSAPITATIPDVSTENIFSID